MQQMGVALNFDSSFYVQGGMKVPERIPQELVRPYVK